MEEVREKDNGNFFFSCQSRINDDYFLLSK